MRKKIECLERLFALLKCRNDLLQFLKEEGVINDDTMQNTLHEHHGTHATKIAGMLEEAVRTEKLQLVDYEWTILPIELVKLTIVSRNSKKEFAYEI